MKSILLSLSLLFVLLFTFGCGGGGGNAGQTAPTSADLSNAQFWTFYSSAGMPTNPSSLEPTGFEFTFPNLPGHVNYMQAAEPVPSPHQLTIVFEIDSTGAVYGQADPGDHNPATFHIMIQRAGDNYSGQGAYDFYRLWYRWDVTTNNLDVFANQGPITITVPLNDPTQWGSVFGHTPTEQQFQDTLANIANVAFTFGGQDFDGHGVFLVSGVSVFKVISFHVN